MNTKADARKGRQIPTKSFVLPYTQTEGERAIALYNKTGRTAQEWQEQLIYDMLAVNEDGLWVHTKFGFSVPRRNGKNEVTTMRELYGLVYGNEHIMHTAHRTTTTHAAWERLLSLLGKLGYVEGENFKTHKQFGLETIEMFDSESRINFRTRTSKGGLGEGYDLLVIDEAQEYQDDQESALKYIVTDSSNPQTIFLGTPPTPVSSGTVFMKMRQKVLAGEADNSAWEEWSVDSESDPHDRELWYETNPSLGTVFTERSIADEIGSDVIDFNIQRLGLWIRYNQKSAISAVEWNACKVEKLPKFTGPLFAGIKYNSLGDSVSLAIAVKTEDERTFTEVIDCKNTRLGNAWLVDFLKATMPKKIIVDGASGQQKLSEDLKDAGVKNVVLPTVKDVIAANAKLEPMIEQRTICHNGQPSLAQAVTNCEHRAIGSNGGYGYRTIRQGVDCSLIDSMIMAVWAADEFKAAAKKQKVNY